jgi:hypothetical protein
MVLVQVGSGRGSGKNGWVAVAEKMSGSISGWQWQGGSRVRRVRRFEVDVQKKIGRNRSSIEGVVAFLVQVDGIVVARFSRKKIRIFFHQKYRFADQKSPLFPSKLDIFLSKN